MKEYAKKVMEEEAGATLSDDDKRKALATHEPPEALTTAWLKAKVGPYYVSITARHGATSDEIRNNVINLINATEECKELAQQIWGNDDTEE